MVKSWRRIVRHLRFGWDVDQHRSDRRRRRRVRRDEFVIEHEEEEKIIIIIIIEYIQCFIRCTTRDIRRRGRRARPTPVGSVDGTVRHAETRKESRSGPENASGDVQRNAAMGEEGWM